MTGFVQVIEYQTSRMDEIDAFMVGWRDKHPQMGPNRVTVCAERGQPGRYLTIVEFSLYEEAMRNSQDPATQEFAAYMQSVCDGPPVFHDLDVLRNEIRTGAATFRTLV
ncbi:MAG: hypothetical protein JWN08_471 [Frankiales bacterium]|nr:hypothetical protein [Frankiales bacterium]